ncbi:MAG: 50S ribosomal protein L22 [Mycoplasmataceae bacterium]|jgi:ribosomal protein L22|nr:50S ribosomal protein L22 [Mycoplasmataceae bacterium]
MKSFAIQKQIHISPRKLGLVCDLVRFKSVIEAQNILINLDKKGAGILLTLLNSAVANGTNNFGMNISNMYILETVANEGPIVKRTLPRAKGSASLLRKRNSHLSINLSDDLNDKKSLHLKPSGKSKITKQKSIKRIDKYVVNEAKIKHEEYPEVITPSTTISPAKEVKIAATIEKEEEKGANE